MIKLLTYEREKLMVIIASLSIYGYIFIIACAMSFLSITCTNHVGIDGTTCCSWNYNDVAHV